MSDERYEIVILGKKSYPIKCDNNLHVSLSSYTEVDQSITTKADRRTYIGLLAGWEKSQSNEKPRLKSRISVFVCKWHLSDDSQIFTNHAQVVNIVCLWWIVKETLERENPLVRTAFALSKIIIVRFREFYCPITHFSNFKIRLQLICFPVMILRTE